MFDYVFMAFILYMGLAIGCYIQSKRQEYSHQFIWAISFPLLILLMNIVILTKVNSIKELIPILVYMTAGFPLIVLVCTEILSENEAYNKAADKLKLKKHSPIWALWTLYSIWVLDEKGYKM